MRSKGFHRVFQLSILVVLLCCVSAVDDSEEFRCPYNIHVKKGEIIKATESRDNGAKFLGHATVSNAKECYRLCCEREYCDLAQMQYKNSSTSDGFYIKAKVAKICFMFYCGIPTKCRFGEHDHYATISYERSDEKLLNLDGNQYEIPPKKVNKPEWNEKSQYRPSEPEGDDEEEKDLGSDSYKSSLRQQTKEVEEHKDLHSSWQTKPEERDPEYMKKAKEFGKAIYHSKSTKQSTTTKDSKDYEQPVYQGVVAKKLEKPAQHVEVKPKGPVIAVEKVKEEHKELQHPTQGNDDDDDDDDAELEMKLEELTPPSKKPKHVLATPPTTFHHWREFVDNNPNFPYTIPVNHKKTTPKPTTEKRHEVPTTKHRTTEQTTRRKVVKTEARKTTEKTTTKEKARPQEDKSHGEVVHTKPPSKPAIIDFPLPNKNVSDVVVIETHRLKIIENKAVLPLAIFLVLAILLLFVVALRLRIVKSKLKRRPFATDDADYLINGMYL